VKYGEDEPSVRAEAWPTVEPRAGDLRAGQLPAGQLPAEELMDLQRAMSRISKADRRLLWLKYVEKKRGAEIAAGLGVPPAVARRRLARAAQRLREALGPGYGGSD
jgi:DNA-directed RNA polymerase specialized sigma24 family protein